MLAGATGQLACPRSTDQGPPETDRAPKAPTELALDNHLNDRDTQGISLRGGRDPSHDLCSEVPWMKGGAAVGLATPPPAWGPLRSR